MKFIFLDIDRIVILDDNDDGISNFFEEEFILVNRFFGLNDSVYQKGSEIPKYWWICFQSLKKARHILFRVVKKGYHLLLLRVKGYTYLISAHIETLRY